MISLPNNWNNVKADDGSFQTLPAGIYKMVVKQATVKQSKSNKQMLVLCFDVSEGEYKDYFMNLYAKRHEEASVKGEQAKYPNNGCFYQLIEGDFLPRFKYLINCFEESNNGYTFTGDEKSLVGKVFGGVMREEEYESQKDGSIKTIVRCDRIIPVSKMESTKVPACKKLKKTTQEQNNNSVDSIEIPF